MSVKVMPKVMSDDELIAQIASVFFEPARRLPQLPMTEEQTRFMAMILFTPGESLVAAWEKALEDGVFEVRLIEKQSGVFRRETNPAVKFLLTQFCASPADVVMYLTFAHARLYDMMRSSLDMDAWCHIFPNGYWQEADRHALWKRQKLSPGSCSPFTDNGLDEAAVIEWVYRE